MTASPTHALPPAAAWRRHAPRAILSAAILAALFVAFHYLGNTVPDVHSRSVFVWMRARWADRISFGADYSFGWLVPFVSFGILWMRRRQLVAAPRRVWPAAFAGIAAGLLLHWAGTRIQQPRLSLAALILLLGSIPATLYGPSVGRLLVFPCAYLAFCIPMNFLDGWSFPLRLLSTAVSSSLLAGLGFHVQRVGTAVFLAGNPGIELDVADPCSGLRYLLAMAAITAAYSFLFQKTLARKWLLFIAAVPIAVAGNVVRIVTIALVGRFLGRETAMTVYHDYSGYLIFVVAILLMLALGTLLERCPPIRLSFRRRGAAQSDAPAPAGKPPAARPLEPLSRAEAWAHGMILIALALTCLGLYADRASALQDAPGLRLDMPAEAGAWLGREMLFCHDPSCGREVAVVPAENPAGCPSCGAALHPMTLVERNQLPSDTLFRKALYTNNAGDRLQVSIVLSGAERASIHRPQRCLVGQGYSILHSRVVSMPMPERPPLAVMLLDILSVPRRSPASGAALHPAKPSVYAYWFVGRDRETPYHLVRMFWLAWDRLSGRAAHRWAYVAISLPDAPSGGPAIPPELLSFLPAWYPQVRIPPESPSHP